MNHYTNLLGSILKTGTAYSVNIGGEISLHLRPDVPCTDKNIKIDHSLRGAIELTKDITDAGRVPLERTVNGDDLIVYTAHPEECSNAIELFSK